MLVESVLRESICKIFSTVRSVGIESTGFESEMEFRVSSMWRRSSSFGVER